MASGEVEESGGSLKILVRRIIPLSAIRGELLDNIVISPDFEKLNDKDLNHFIRICKKNPGEKKLFFKVKEKNQGVKTRQREHDHRGEFGCHINSGIYVWST